MKDNFPKFLYLVLGIFIVGVVGYVSMVTIFACGVSRNCSQAQAMVVRTPIAVPPPAYLPTEVFTNAVPTAVPSGPEACRVVAASLIDAWTAAGLPQEQPFTFVDSNGKSCEASYTADVQPLFNKVNFSLQTMVSAGTPLP